MAKSTTIILTWVITLALTGCSLASNNATPRVPQSTTSINQENMSEIIKQQFMAKYPKYARTITVRIDQQTDNHLRGGVSMVPGVPGGIFLAAKTNGQWQIVHDGNGQIPCTLSSYGFPANMLADCAK